MSVGDWAEEAKKMGLDGIDISINFIKNNSYTYLREIKESLAKSGMNIIMATSYPDFTHPDAVQRDREKDYFIRDIALCSELGVKYLRILAGQAHPQTSRADGIRWVVENFRDCAKAAQKYGITLLYENHSKPGAWDYCDFSYPLDIFFDIFESIKDMGIRLNFDIGNIVSCGQNPVAILEKVYDYVDTIHISDVKTAEKFSPTLLGTGIVPIGEVFSYLKGRGFQGWYCIEEAGFQGLEGVKKAVDYARETYKNA
ncbi:Xylose isomerase domain protein TIM barrel [Christensenella hongkongensis]|uniref:Xylose isomerase domain protein TIM barrel n=2 Tax=Christensenella hongkongensis TaxID=270498 RepID=A0A0M2NHJ3_9FIRM|nr:Xylose isomerase domain protein TIM barrel [Christensenella hongkongensis]